MMAHVNGLIGQINQWRILIGPNLRASGFQRTLALLVGFRFVLFFKIGPGFRLDTEQILFNLFYSIFFSMVAIEHTLATPSNRSTLSLSSAISLHSVTTQPWVCIKLCATTN